MNIWDGLSLTRQDVTVRKAPDGEDWKTITKEVQAVQEFLISLASNAENMPNLVEDIKTKQKDLKELQDAITKLKTPEDLMKRLEEIENRMVDLSNIYSHASEVLQTVQFLQRQLLNLGKRIQNHISETDVKYRAFENRVANWQKANEERWHTRLEKAEEQLGAIALALGIKKFGE